MIKITNLLFVSILTLGMTHASAQVSNETFAKAINSTTNYYTSIKQLSANEIKTTFLVTGNHPTDKTLVVSYNINIVFKNLGDKYIIAAGLPSLVPPLYSEMCKFGGIVDDILDHHYEKIVEYSYYRGDASNPVVLITKEYGSKNAIGIMTGMVKLVNKLGKAWQGIAAQQQKIAIRSVNEFMKEKVVGLDNDWLAYYVESDDLTDYVKEVDLEGAIGRWTWWYGNMFTSYYNYRDHFEIYVTAEFEEGESTDDFQEGAAEFITKNKLKNATSTIASLQNGKFYGVKITYDFDGEIKGQDFVDGYKDVFKYAKRLEKVFY